jgi:putative inorganic carbon (hco3(-)) transporter
MRVEQLLENQSRIMPYVFAVVLAVVAGYYLGQGLGYQILTVAGLFAGGWLLFFLAQPANAILLIVFVRTLAERFNFNVAGPFTVNALLYCAIFGGGFVYTMSNRAACRHNAATRVYTCFILYALVPAFFTPDRTDGIAAWVREGAMFMSYFLFANLMTDRKNQRRYVGVIMALAVINTGVAGLQLAGLYPYATGFYGRCTGTFMNGPVFAYFQLLPINLASGFLMFSWSWKVKLGCLLLLPFCLASLALSWTRGAWIAAVVSLGLVSLLGRKWFLPIAAGAMALTWVLFQPLIEARFSPLLKTQELNTTIANATTSGRVEIWSRNLPLLKDHLFFGRGLQSFIFFSGGFDAHNGFFKLLFETGIVGLSLYCAFFGINLYYALLAWRRARDSFESALCLALLSMFITFLVATLWENLFLGQGPQWFLYSAAGVTAAVVRNVRNTPVDPVAPVRPLAYAVP